MRSALGSVAPKKVGVPGAWGNEGLGDFLAWKGGVWAEKASLLPAFLDQGWSSSHALLG